LEYTYLLRQGAHNDELRKGDASTAVRELSPAMLRAGEKALWHVLAGSGGDLTERYFRFDGQKKWLTLRAPDEVDAVRFIPGGWCGLISDVAIAHRRAPRAPLAWNLGQKAHR
jgi:hypothetical protein